MSDKSNVGVRNMGLKELILGAGLQKEVENTIEFTGSLIPYYRCRRESETVKAGCFSEYFFVELTDELLSKICNRQNFRDFQSRLLSSAFFGYKNDLRWNLYLIMLIDDNSTQIKEIDVKSIENDDNFARKYFFTYQQAKNFLNRKGRFSRESVVEKDGFEAYHYQTWVEILRKVGLSGCLRNKFLSRHVEEYLHGTEFQDEEFRQGYRRIKKTRNSNVRIIENIQEVHLENFRSHCFRKGQSIKPVRVNLIHGANGCGKTSITEAVEFAITNNIRRMKDFRDTSISSQTVKIVCQSGYEQVTFDSKKNSTAKCKELDRDWYGIPLGAGLDTLNKSFSRFNYFDSDAPYKFALGETSNEVEYQDKFARLFFDDELINMEKNWVRYRDEFLEQSKKLNKVSTQNQKEKESLSNSVIQFEQQGNLDLAELNKCLIESKLMIDHNSFKNNVMDYVQNVYEIFQTSQSHVETLKRHFGWIAPYTIISVCHKERILNTELHKREASLNTELTRKQEIIKSLKEINEFLEETIPIIEKNNRGIEYCKKTLEEWETFKQVLIDSVRTGQFFDYYKRQSEIETALNAVKTVNSLYPRVNEYSINDISILSTQQIEELKEQYLTNVSEKEKCEKILELANQKADEINQLKIRLKALGFEYLEKDSGTVVCPLCGVKHDSHELLIESISENEGQAANNKTLLQEEQRLIKLNEAIENTKTRLRIHEENQIKLGNLLKSAGVLNQSREFVLNTSQDANSILENVKRVLNNDVRKLEYELQNINNSILNLEEAGFTQQNISIAENFKQNNRLVQKFVENGQTDFLTFEKFIIDTWNNLISENSKFNENVEVKQAEKKANDLKVQSLEENSLTEEIKQLKTELGYIEQIKLSQGSLKSFFDLTDEEDLSNWTKSFEVAKSNCEVALGKVKNQYQIKVIRDRIKEIEKQEEDITKRTSRCKTALTAFDGMPTLSSSIGHFMNNKQEVIGYFFELLHRPKEFINPQIDENGISVERVRTNENVRGYQMSSGQRAALALSVLFALHLSAKNAPRFILFDEPVANMDDLHLLNLLDILREFALEGTQIIFTTANPDVAALFRRKFSFFEDQFKHFELTRNMDEETKIEEIMYNPFEEVAISQKEVS